MTARRTAARWLAAALAAAALAPAQADTPAPATTPSLAIVVYGGTGQIGRRIVDEALARGHRVTVVTRHPPAGTAPRTRVTYASGDILDAAGVQRQLAGQDAVINATSGGHGLDPAGEDFHLRAAHALVTALRALGGGAPRLVVVGGAGSLEAAPGRTVIDTLPMLAHGEPVGQQRALAYYRGVGDVAWTYLSPALRIAPGERTGHFRLGGDALLRDAAGESRISIEDFAVALLDEIERPTHPRQRFTVAY